MPKPSNQELTEAASNVLDVDQDAKWELGRILSEVVKRTGPASKAWKAACSEIGASGYHARNLLQTYQMWPPGERLPVSWTCHRELGILAKRLDCDKWELANDVVRWAQEVERRLAEIDGRPAPLVLYPSTRYVRGYRKVHLPGSLNPKVNVKVPIVLIGEIQRALRDADQGGLADQLGRILAKQQITTDAGIEWNEGTPLDETGPDETGRDQTRQDVT